MATAETIKKVAEILDSNPERRFAIVSAPGKRYERDTKITDILYRCFSAEYAEAKEFFETVADRFRSLSRLLGVTVDLENAIKRYKSVLSEKTSVDSLVAMGEHLSALILSAYLGWQFVDARKLIVFDSNGNCDYSETNAIASAVLKKYMRAVIPGFYGRNRQYQTVTFSRGGSDITGAIVAAAVNADLYENWTDVSGVFAADPKIVENPKTIDSLSYKELRKLSYSGATVIQADSVFPVKESGVPIVIKNTFEPEEKGTKISLSRDDAKNEVVGITGKKGYASVSIDNPNPFSVKDFEYKILSVFEKCRIKIEKTYFGVDSVTVIVTQKNLEKYFDEFYAAIIDYTSVDCVKIRKNLALVSVVGHGEKFKIRFVKKTIDTLVNEQIDFDMVGGDKTLIVLSVDCVDYEKTINSLYKELN